MADLLYANSSVPLGSGWESIQYGDKLIMVNPYMRPLVVTAAGETGSIKAYPCGIKAPLWYPTVAANAIDAENLVAGSEIRIAYAYYSSIRGVMSQMSPVWHGVVSATPAKQLAVSGFWNPRDDASANDIDTIIIAVQIETNSGLMWLPGVTEIRPTSSDWSTQSIVIDISQEQLEQGVDMTGLNSALFVPPAVAHIGLLGERLWVGGQRRKVEFSGMAATVRRAQIAGRTKLTNGSAGLDGTGYGTAYTTDLVAGDIMHVENVSEVYSSVRVVSVVTDADTATFATTYGDATGLYTLYHDFRGGKYARIRLSGTGTYFDDSHLHMKVIVNGRYIGNILDVVDPLTAYLDCDVDASIAETTSFYLLGHNDRIWPSAYTTNSPGGIPWPIPEAIQLADGQMLMEMIDQGQTLRRMHTGQDRLALIFSDSIVTMTGGSEPGIPQPVFLRLHGRVGTTSSASVTVDDAGQIWMIGEEGLIQTSTSSAIALSHQMGIREFFRGGQWLDSEALSSVKMEYSRHYRALVLGGLTVGGSDNYWGLITMEPQPGLWIFSGQEITSNICEYLGDDGASIMLAGDAFSGRVKRLLDPAVLTDVAVAASTTAAYNCQWWSGYLSIPSADRWSIGTLRLTRIILPGSTAGTLTFSVARSDVLVRDIRQFTSIDGRLADQLLTNTISTANSLNDFGMTPNAARFLACGIAWDSTSGSVAATTESPALPMEVAGWTALEVQA